MKKIFSASLIMLGVATALVGIYLFIDKNDDDDGRENKNEWIPGPVPTEKKKVLGMDVALN